MKKIMAVKSDAAILAAICIFLFLGSGTGALLSLFSEGAVTPQEFTAMVQHNGKLADVVLQYSQIAVLLWMGGFFSFGPGMISALLFLRGTFYGYMSCSLVTGCGWNGLLYTTFSCLIQNLIILPVYIAVAYFSMKNIFAKLLPLSGKMRLKREQNKIFLEYITIVPFSLLCIFIAAAVECYLVPIFLGIFLA